MSGVDLDVGVVLPAAGLGERIGGPNPKQYVKVMGKPLFLHAVEAFLSLSYVKRIALVVDNVEKVSYLLKEYGLCDPDVISLVSGAKSRHRSIKAGLQDLHKNNPEGSLKVVVIHDAVRPLVPLDLVTELVESAVVEGASGAVRPLVSTVVKPSSDMHLDSVLQRDLYYASETPQAFLFDTIYSAYEKCTEDELDCGTECLRLALDYCGTKAKLVVGGPDLWKVTHQKDIYSAAACLHEKSVDVCIIPEEANDMLDALVVALSNRVNSLETIFRSELSSKKDFSQTFNTIILFHLQEIHQDLSLLNFANLLDLDRQGLIIHIINHSSVEGLQSMSVYNLHKNSCKMSHHYEKLRKGVAVVHCVSSSESDKLADIVYTLVQSDPHTFSGQSFFL